MRIEHKVIREKDYTAGILSGFIWILISFAISLLTWYAGKNLVGITFTSVGATLLFCYSIYIGRSSFEPVMREEVIHVVKR